jgi:cytochrome c peroxidase
MNKTSLLLVICLVAAALVCTTGCATKPAKVEIAQAKLAMFKPLPAEIASDANPITPEKIALGRMLYYETRLSKSQEISCNSCHMLDKYGVDNQATSDGHKGQKGDRNSPTVYNAAGHFVQFWDGRALNVEEQAKGPVLNPVEMAMPAEKHVVAVIESIPEYVAAFKAAFPQDKNPVTYDNMARAIGAFERKLVTPSRWDKFLAGDQNALTESEKAGFNLFVDSGCNACHMGAFVGGSMYQKLGVMKPYPDAGDPGRAKVTKNDGDKMMFKVPSLRNVEKTAPYFHNGKVATLDDAVAQMGEYEVGKQLKPEEVKAIVAWLATLTGEIPTEYIKPPALPKSTPKTPKPDTGD